MRNVRATSLGARPSLAISAFRIPHSAFAGWRVKVLRDHRNPVRRRGRGSHAGPRWGGGARGASRGRAGDAVVSPCSCGSRGRVAAQPGDATAAGTRGWWGSASDGRGGGRAHAPHPGADRAAPGAPGIGGRAGDRCPALLSGASRRASTSPPRRARGVEAMRWRPAARAARRRGREGAPSRRERRWKKGRRCHRRKPGTLGLTGPTARL